MEKNKIIIETENLIKEAANLNCGISFKYVNGTVTVEIQILDGEDDIKHVVDEIVIWGEGGISYSDYNVPTLKLFTQYIAYLVKTYNKERR